MNSFRKSLKPLTSLALSFLMLLLVFPADVAPVFAIEP